MVSDWQVITLYVRLEKLTRLNVADRDIYVADASSPATPRGIDEAHPAAATAAVALAQLHHNRLASDWDTDMVCGPNFFVS